MNQTSDTEVSRPYHHGDLKAALLEKAEEILEHDGIQALTLRAAARAVGVSHAAPKNHFGDMTGLLSDLAALGFQRFAAALVVAGKTAGDDPRERMKAMGRAYVSFARAHPGLFVLMFRSERLDANRPTLHEGILAARAALRGAVSASSGGTASPLQMAAHAAAVWSLMHGFSLLLMEGRLNGIIASLPDNETADSLLEAVLAGTTFGPI